MSTAPGSTASSNSLKLPSECHVCGGSGPFSILPGTHPFPLFECPHCGLVFLYPQLGDEELASYYDKTYYGTERKKFFVAIEASVAALTARKWNRLQPLLGPGGRFLDVGCGRGTLVRLAREAGFEGYGVEREFPGGPTQPWIYYKDLLECNFADEYFQVVVLWHVLEHLKNPRAALHEIHRVLKPGGWLSLAVPNYGGAQAQASGKDWFHLDLPRHLWHFRQRSLELLMKSEGFTIEEVKTLSIEYDWFGTLQSWLNRAFHDDNGLYSTLKRDKPRSAADMAARVTTAAILAPAALGGALWDAALGKGGTLTVLARKPAP